MAFFIKPKTLKLILTAFIFSAFFCIKNSVYAEISADNTERKSASAIKTVKVGWFETVSNVTCNVINSHNERSGFCYEYQQEIRSYTGWQYEYVSGTWSELFELLKQGKIDLLSGVTYCPDRENEILFSETAMFEESCYIYAKNKEPDFLEYMPSDFSWLNGRKIGIVLESNQKFLLEKWASDKKIDLDIVVIQTPELARKFLEDGKIFGYVSSDESEKTRRDLKSIVCIGKKLIKFGISKNRLDLKRELDQALEKINFINPYFDEDLARKYISRSTVATLSHEEIDWVRQHSPLRIAYLDNNLAMSGIDPKTGKLIGTVEKYIEFAGNCFTNGKLTFEPIPFSNLEAELQALKNGEVDIIFQISQNPFFGEKYDMLLSDTVLKIPMVAVTMDKFFNETEKHTVAVFKNDFPLRLYLSTNYPSWEIVLCESHQQCEQFVKSGKAECFVMNSNSFSNSRTLDSMFSIYLTKLGNMAFAVRPEDTLLMSILNQSIYIMPESLMIGALAIYSNAIQKFTLDEILRNNFLAITGAIIGSFLLVILIIQAFLKKTQKAELMTKEAMENTLLLNEELKKSHDELQQALTAAENANAAKTIFLNNMSHDIRTPMNAIIGFTNIALKESPKESIKSCLLKIAESSDHLLTLINDVLDISRIESGKTKFEPVPVNIHELTDSVLDIMQGLLSNRDLIFNVERSLPKSPYVLADQVRIREVLVNILSNAVKFTDDGGSINFRTEFRPGKTENQVIVIFSVKDTGIGMSQEFIGKIFDEFAQENSDARTHYKGTGLGMAITKRYIELMSGRIFVESKKGMGTTVTVEIPMEYTNEDNIQKLPSSASKANLKNVKVLIVEDNDLNAEIATMQLEDLGLDVTRVCNGKEAVEKFESLPENTFDLILMDIMMPLMNGYEATQTIRAMKNRSDSQNIPIIAMTANAFAEDVKASIDAGMNAHLAKPIVIEDLVNVIRRCLQKSSDSTLSRT